MLRALSAEQTDRLTTDERFFLNAHIYVFIYIMYNEEIDRGAGNLLSIHTYVMSCRYES